MKKNSIILICLLALVSLFFLFLNRATFDSIKGALLRNDQEIEFLLKERADTNTDGVLSTREIRTSLIGIIRGVILGSSQNDINGDGIVNRTDIIDTIRAFRALLQSVCGNSVIEAGETCDDNDTDSGDGCSETCILESGYTCTGEPSVCTAISNTPLTITVLPAPSASNTTVGSQNLTFMRFRATAGNSQIQLNTAMFGAVAGDLASLTNLSLWRDTNGDGTADTKVLDRNQQNSTPDVLVFFDSNFAQNRTIATGQSAIFEVRGDIASSAPVPSDIGLEFKTDLVNFIGKNQTDTSEYAHLVGIKTDGLCLFTCEIDVTTVPSTLWHIQ